MLRVTTKGIDHGLADPGSILPTRSSHAGGKEVGPSTQVSGDCLARYEVKGTDLTLSLVQSGENIRLDVRLRDDKPSAKPRATFVVPTDEEPSGPRYSKIAGSEIKMGDTAYGALSITIARSKSEQPFTVKVWNKPEAVHSAVGITMPPNVANRID